ncbi:MAG: MBOAT family protein, partial [Candidatus Omnitrophica bacterium]|nr:MBOAT family protein [Candidatus Omnitrophota bacterium]
MIDYAAGVHISKSSDQRVKKKWLIASIITNLGLLGYFKYCNFFLETINAALSAIGFSAPLPHFNIILPVGISFYTFQSMSYTIDLY